MTIVLVMILFLGVMMWSSSRTRKKQQQQQQQMRSSLEPGTWVRTIGGLYLRFVDHDGDVMVLETPEGTELYLAARAVAAIEEPPFSPDDAAEEQNTDGESDVEQVTDEGNAELADSTENPQDNIQNDELGEPGDFKDKSENK